MKKQLWNNPRPDDPTYAFNRALRYLSLRARSEKEIREYLSKREFTQSASNDAIARLKSLKFLSDEEFSKSFARSRQVYKGRSKRFVSYELKQKGVESETIEKVMSDSQDDLQTAKEFVERKKRVYASMDKVKFKEKMMRLLSSRGFSFDIIKAALNNE